METADKEHTTSHKNKNGRAVLYCSAVQCVVATSKCIIILWFILAYQTNREIAVTAAAEMTTA